MIKQFYTFAEAAEALQTDLDGLTQALQLGLWRTLPVYIRTQPGCVYCAELLGVYCNEYGEFLKGDAEGEENSASTLTLDDLGDDICRVQSWGTKKTGGSNPKLRPVAYLTGFFRVFKYSVEDAIETLSFAGGRVAPTSWWNEDGIMPQETHGPKELLGEPIWSLMLADKLDNATDSETFTAPPKLVDAYFRIGDVLALAANSSNVSPAPLDPRERASFLRIIRALSTMAKLPARGATASVEKELQILGFDRPKEAAIRKILDEARALSPDNKPQ